MKQQPPRRLWLLLCAPALVLAAPLALRVLNFRWPAALSIYYPRQNKMRAGCSSNLKMLAMMMKLYAADYDGRLAPATVGGTDVPGLPVPRATAGAEYKGLPVGWADALQPYLRSTSLYQCPAEPGGPTIPAAYGPSCGAYTDYWLNARLSARRTSTLSAPASTFLLGEGNDGRDLCNATYSKSSLPADWLSDTRSPLFRHLSGANFLFVDGHVAWLSPQQAQHPDGRADPFAP